MNEISRGEPFRGSVGQTSYRSVQLPDGSGATVPVEVYRAVNATTDPELVQPLLAGELNRVDLADNDEVFEPAVPLYYHDEERRLFALVVPEVLRHAVFECRRELLDELNDCDVAVPAYVRDYEVVVGFEQLERLARSEASSDVEPAASSGPDGLVEERRELERARAALEEERTEVDERRRELEQMRDELDARRRRLDRERENLESRGEHGSTTRGAEESAAAGGSPGARNETPSDTAPARGGPEESAVRERPEELTRSQRTVVRSDHPPSVPSAYEALSVETSRDGDLAVGMVEGGALAAARLHDGERIAALTSGRLDFFVQYRTEGDYPVIGLLLAALDDRGQPAASVGWPVDPAGHGHGVILDKLAGETALHTALYGPDGELLEAHRIRAPYEANLEWILDRVERDVESGRLGAGTFAEAASAYVGPDRRRLGEMRFNFDREEFRRLETPSDVQLAASVVGHWSSGDEFEYLVSDRSYPLSQFRDLQRAVATAAVEHGILPAPPLREIALEEVGAKDERALVEQVAANFAEVVVELRENDLEAADEWENWSAIVELAGELDADLDPEMIELAETSLERVRAAHEAPGRESEPPTGAQRSAASPGDNPGAPAGETTDAGAASHPADRVVSQQSEARGVAYFSPDSDVVDRFDELADVPRDELIALLDDPERRLEAAQMALDRFEAGVVAEVLEIAEGMSGEEVAALARFLEDRAGELESELIDAVEWTGPNGTFAATWALAQIESTSALPTLLRAYRDRGREVDVEKLARTVARYGETLLPSLRQSIQSEGLDDRVRRLVRELADRDASLIERLENDRNEEVRRVAAQVRD